MKYFKKTTLKLILNFTQHLFFVAILALIPFSSSSQGCDSPFQDWVLLSTSATQCGTSPIQNELNVLHPDGNTSCRSDWGSAQIFDHGHLNDIKYVFITPGDYRWLGTLEMRGLCGSEDNRKHIVYISDADGVNGYQNEIDDYINSRELETPMDDISDPNSIVPHTSEDHTTLPHAIIENMRLYEFNTIYDDGSVADNNGVGNYIIKGLTFSGKFGGIEDIVVDGGDVFNTYGQQIEEAGYFDTTYNEEGEPKIIFNKLTSTVYNNIATNDELIGFLNAEDGCTTSGLRNMITGGTNVTLDRILIENVRRGNALRLKNCHDFVVSNSIIRNSYNEFCTLYDTVIEEDDDNLVNGASDNIGISVNCLEPSCYNISIVNNKIYNTSDGIHFVHYLDSDPELGNFPNGLVENNDIYFEDALYLYRDDEDKVQQWTTDTPDDELQMIQGEDGIDVKIGGIDGSPLVIKDNNIFGWRRAFGTGGDGFAINCHINASYVTIESNHIYDCQNGIGLTNINGGNPNLTDSLTVTNNVIEDLYLGTDHCDPKQINEFLEDDLSTPYTDERGKSTGLGISSSLNKDVNISGNCISETIRPLVLNGWKAEGISGGGNMYVTGNTCTNNTKPMFLMREILLNNPSAFSNFTDNIYEYYEDGASQIFECCNNLPNHSDISEYDAATSANSFILSEVISSSIDSDNLCQMNTVDNNISCFTDCENSDSAPSAGDFSRSVTHTCNIDDGAIGVTWNANLYNNIYVSIDGGTTYSSTTGGSFSASNLNFGTYDIRVKQGETGCPVTLDDANILDLSHEVTRAWGHPTCGQDDGWIELTWVKKLNKIDISIDGGLTYEEQIPAANEYYRFDGLTTGNYDVRVRWTWNAYECPVQLDDVNLGVKPTATTDFSLSYDCVDDLQLIHEDIGANRYQFRYRTYSDGVWDGWKNSTHTTNLTNTISDLPDLTKVKVRSRVYCGGRWSAWGQTRHFNLPACRLGKNIENNFVSIFPNPASQLIQINLGKNVSENATISIYNLAGKQLITKTLMPKQSDVQLNVNDLSNGIYLVKIMADTKEIHTQKLTISH